MLVCLLRPFFIVFFFRLVLIVFIDGIQKMPDGSSGHRNVCVVHSHPRGVATVRHFRHVSTHICFPKILLLMKNDKQRITYFNYVCFMFIVLMKSFHRLKDKHLQ